MTGAATGIRLEWRRGVTFMLTPKVINNNIQFQEKYTWENNILRCGMQFEKKLLRAL